MSLRRSSRRSSHLASEALATGFRPSRSRTASIVEEDIDTTPARSYRDAAAHPAALDEDSVSYSGTPVRRARLPGTGRGKGKTPAKSAIDGPSTAAAKTRGRRKETVLVDEEEDDQNRRGESEQEADDRENDHEDQQSQPVVKKLMERVRRISRELTPTSTPDRRSRRISQQDDEDGPDREVGERDRGKDNPFVRRLREVAEEEGGGEEGEQTEDELENTDGQTLVPWRWEYAGEVYDQCRNCAACFWPLALIVVALFGKCL